MQATVYRYDPETGGGSVLADDGEVIPFEVDAMLESGLRHVRPGQRLTVMRDGDRITALYLGSIRP